MSQISTQINQQLDDLLAAQDDFLALVHSQVYHAQQPLSEAILKFEINHISDLNDKFNQTIAQMTQELIDKKTSYELALRDKFHRLLQADYLPLLRFSRIEITKLSLYGFDIYVEPLQAFLHILSRLDTLKQKILESQIEVKDNQNSQSALEKGWDSFSLAAVHWKLSFNLYILKEYLNVGSKSFLRKDREILFTGISNFYCGLVPALKKRNITKILLEVADLNNALYYFHPSFNYFQFYSLLLPLSDSLEPVFSSIKQISEKCVRTKILTPLLFGILRNRQAFLQFVSEVDSPVWLPYLNAIIAGIAINLKLRILEYEEIIQLFEETVLKAGLLGAIRVEEVLGGLEQGWKDAKDFFISAVKIGFNSGDAQTWKSIDFQAIGSRIIESLLDGMLMDITANQANLDLYLQNGEEKIDAAIKSISQGKIDMYFIKNTIYQLQNNLTTDKQFCLLIQIANLIKINSLANEYSLNFAISCFNRIMAQPSKKIIAQRLTEAAEGINEMLFELVNPNFTFLKDKILDFHQHFPPASNFQKLLDLYTCSFEPKKCLTSLLSLKIEQARFEEFILLILSRYVPKPSSKQIILKTFDSQFKTKSGYVNVSYQTHCLLNFVTLQLTKDSLEAQKIIKILIKVCPWINFALLNFPINFDGHLFSFSTWLVGNAAFHQLLCYLLKESKDTILSQKGEDLIKILLYPSILDHLSKRVNEISEIELLKKLCSLTLQVAVEMQVNTQFLTDLLAVELYLLQKDQNQKYIAEIVKDIAILSQFAFRDNLKPWLLSLLRRRVEGKSDLSIGHRKRVLKTNNANVYFLGETLDSNEITENLYQPVEQLKSRLSSSQSTALPISSSQFDSTLKTLSQISYQSFQQLDEKQSTVFLEEVKNFSVPKISESLLLTVFESKDTTALEFLSLNFENYVKFIEIAISKNDVDYLSRQRFDKNLNKYIPNLLEMEKIGSIGLLAKMSQNLSFHQKIMISESFFLDSSILPFYCEHASGIQYLTAFNGNNWRILIDYFGKEFSIANLPSTILQYHEFLRITGQKNTEYEKIITKYSAHFSCFAYLISFKMNFICQLSTSQEELSLRSANELSLLNIALSSMQLKEILLKLAVLNQTLIQKELPPLTQWIEIATLLNSNINQLYPGECLLRNFIFSFYLTNSTVYQVHKTELGLYLERYYQNMGEEIQTKDYYFPESLEAVTFQQFTELENVESKIIKKQGLSQEEINKSYKNVIAKLQQSNLVKVQGKSIRLSLKNTASIANAKDFYTLGCLQALASQPQRNELLHLLHSAANRKVIPWEMLKQVDGQGFSHISNIIADPEIAKMNLNFCYKGEALVPNAEVLRVNEYNKLEYCNRVALRLIGPSNLEYLAQFMRGYFYQLHDN